MNTTHQIFDDTICALATPTGGALAIVRLSGPDAIAITQAVFNRDISHTASTTLHYGLIKEDDGSTLDDVVVSVYRAPHSYTGEDSTEISLHGSPYIASRLLQLLSTHGARQAGPGEYTRRAYLNGKMDLSQAEAVASLIAATNKAQHDIAETQLRGGISDRLSALREKLLKLNSLLELELDFGDHEELEFADRTELLSLAQTIDSEVVSLAATFNQGNAIREGIPVAIVGKTNVGKSTLLNRLVGEERAIVSDVEGTTRDTVEDTLTIRGTLFRLIDTAGLRHTADKVEQIGISRSIKAIERSKVVVWVVDGQPSEEEIERMTSLCRGKSLIVACNKADLAPYSAGLPQAIPTTQLSAKSGKGIDQLLSLIYETSGAANLQSGGVVVSNARHYAQLTRAHRHLQQVEQGLSTHLPGDLLSEDLREVISDLGAITGRGIITPQETLNNIFQHFCIGK